MPFVLTRKQLALAAHVYCMGYGLPLVAIPRVMWATQAAGLAVVL